MNTSGEENKNGVDPSEAPSVASHIAANCPDLTVRGVMTIGALARSIESAKRAAECERGQNPDFLALIQARREVAAALDVQPDDLDLSMGMSGDFEEAVRMGSTSVRVGSSIFGARNYGPPKTTTGLEEQVAKAKIS